MGSIFLTYYVVSVIYCFAQLIRTYSKTASYGGLNISPGLDALMVLTMGWALAPVDLILRWITMYKVAEEARRNNEKIV